MAFEIETTRTGDERVKFERVTVLLGANGTGKSKLLAEIRGKIGEVLPDYKILNIEGGRALQMHDHLQLTPQNFNQYRSYDQTFRQYSNKRSGRLQDRIFDGLKTLEQLTETKRIQHSDSVTSWLAEASDDAEVKDVPRRPVDPMERVFEAFNDIFPTIQLSYNPTDKRFRCTKSDSEYGPTSLSDGEKQVFSILVDVVELAEQETVLFVDEPELNLNPGLANRLWRSIESMLPKSIFLYATHSVSFALRDSVGALFIISNIDENIQRIGNLDDLSHAEQFELLGNVTSLLANKKSLLVEGQDESFDTIFYNWILADREISTSAVGSCDDVISIIKRSGKWARISPNVKLAGIIDRDYKPDGRVSEMEKSGVMCLKFHEAESFLCDPSLLVRVAESLGTVEVVPNEGEIINRILSFVNENRLKILARRISAQLDLRLGVSVPAKVLGKISDDASLRSLISNDIELQKREVSKAYDPKLVDDLLTKEIAQIDLAVSRQDVDQLLLFAPGKELLSCLAKLVGCVDGNSVARAVRTHLEVTDFPSLLELQTQIRSAFEVLEA